MDCRRFHRNLEDYLQGELDFAGRFGVERHAQQCFACGRVLGDAQKLGDAARGVARVKAPLGFEEALMRRIQVAKIRRRPWILHRLWFFGWEGLSSRRLAFAGSLAALLVLAAALSYQVLLRRSPAGGIEAARQPAADSGTAIESPADVPPATALTVPEQSAGFESIHLGRGYFDSERGWVSEAAEPVDGEFIELPAPGAPEMTVRLPKSIRVRHAPPPEEYFIRHVSH